MFELVISHLCLQISFCTNKDEWPNKKEVENDILDGKEGVGGCLVPKILQNFSRFLVTRILRHMHEALNIDKK